MINAAQFKNYCISLRHGRTENETKTDKMGIYMNDEITVCL